MVKARHGKANHKKTVNNTIRSVNDSKLDEPILQRAAISSEESDFLQTDSPLLLTLLFRDKVSQHSALARIESFYESLQSEDEKDNSKRFLTLEQAKGQRLCPNYEAFNCPIKSIVEWLKEMQIAHDVKLNEVDTVPEIWWEGFCNEEENVLLKFLFDLGCLNPSDSPKSIPQYLITSLSSQANSSLPHERLHFLYFFSSDYRAFVKEEFNNLSAKTQKVIQTDLTMRGYAKHVWLDEFQAYVSLDSGEFGNASKMECSLIKPKLQQQQRLIWKQLNA